MKFGIKTAKISNLDLLLTVTLSIVFLVLPFKSLGQTEETKMEIQDTQSSPTATFAPLTANNKTTISQILDQTPSLFGQTQKQISIGDLPQKTSYFSSFPDVLTNKTRATKTNLILNSDNQFVADGDLDPSFNPSLLFSTDLASVLALAVQPTDGKILIGGNFEQVAGRSRAGIARLDADGSPNTSFNSEAGFTASQFGISTDKITSADFDGDGRTDIAVFRDGVWYWLNSSNGSFNVFQFGVAGDILVPADFTGGGRAELVIYRSGIWYMLKRTLC